METCPKCNHKFAKYPLKDENGKWILKNLFKMDLIHLLFLLSIIFVIIGFYIDTNKCTDVYNNPIKFCKESHTCNVIQQQQLKTFELKDLNRIESNIQE